MKQLVPASLCLFILVSCSAGRETVRENEPGQKDDSAAIVELLPEPSYKKPEDFNLRLIVKSSPDQQSESSLKTYYRVFLDKEEIGRTSIGLPEEEKSLDAMVSPADHTLSIEKYQLDERKGKYTKLKNIEQPKPDSFSFALPEERIIIINMLDKGAESDAEFSSAFAAEEVYKQNN